MPSSFEEAAVQAGALRESDARGSGPEVAPQNARPSEQRSEDTALVVEELLVEDISIDGMCGVY